MKYQVMRGHVEVKARTPFDETRANFVKVAGTVEFDADDTSAARAEISVDMRTFETGDRLTTQRVRDDLDAGDHPTAELILTRFLDIHEDIAGRYEATATGQLRWRGRSLPVRLRGRATVDRRSLEVSGSFELDLKELGFSSAAFRAFRGDDIVVCQVSLTAFATPS